jgi:hypothetical protein
MWETARALGRSIVETPPALLIVLGAFCFILGAAGGVSYNNWFPVSDWGRYFAIVGGVALAATGVLLSLRNIRGPIPKSEDYQVRITHPRAGDKVDVVDVEGTLSKPLPAGYSLRIFRIYPNSDFLALGQAVIAKKGTGYKWHAAGCDIGGKTNEPRILGVYVVGPIGKFLLDYSKRCNSTHHSTLEQLQKLGATGPYLPNLNVHDVTDTIPDIVECHRVSVVRK